MIHKGTVKRIEINPSGLECCVEIDFHNSIGTINCYMVLAENYKPNNLVNEVQTYVEDGEPITLVIGDNKEFRISVIFATKCSKLGSDVQESIVQPVEKSSYAQLVASVKKIVDENAVYCSIGRLGSNVLVEFEGTVDHLAEADKIKFIGEIKAELEY